MYGHCDPSVHIIAVFSYCTAILLSLYLKMLEAIGKGISTS